MVYNEKQASYLQLLERAQLPNLMNRRLQDISILMYKVKYINSVIFAIFLKNIALSIIRGNLISPLLGITL